MKKYVKPDVYFEEFRLSQHIATCAFEMSNAHDKNHCSASMYEAGMVLFVGGNEYCTVTSLKDHEDYCYNNYDESTSVFNS